MLDNFEDDYSLFVTGPKKVQIRKKKCFGSLTVKSKNILAFAPE
jgi:hypothetical protein